MKKKIEEDKGRYLPLSSSIFNYLSYKFAEPPTISNSSLVMACWRLLLY